MKENKLPDPDTHCWDDDSSKDVWSYSPELVRQIIKADRAQRGEPVACLPEGCRITAQEDLFKTIIIVAPNGCSAVTTSVARNPENVLRMLVQDLLKTAPQPSQPDRKPMPDNEMNDLAFQCGIQREDARDPGVEEFARAIEAFHGIKP